MLPGCSSRIKSPLLNSKKDSSESTSLEFLMNFCMATAYIDFFFNWLNRKLIHLNMMNALYDLNFKISLEIVIIVNVPILLSSSFSLHAIFEISGNDNSS